MKELKEDNNGMFSDYRIDTDDTDMKLVDSSGFHHHGWAVNGMNIHHVGDSGELVRKISKGSFAVLPVPANWDARLWSARMIFEPDTKELAAGNMIGLFKIRMETGGEILVRVRNDNPFPEITVIVKWHGNRLAKTEYQTMDDRVWASQVEYGHNPLK